MINRIALPAILAKKFINDYDAVMKHYNTEQQIELTKHLLDILELVKQYQENKNEKLYKDIQSKEKALVEKYKQSLKPYKAKAFYKFFQFDIVVAEKDIYSTAEYNKLPPDEQQLSDTEINTFLNICANILNSSLDRLYLDSPSDTEKILNSQNSVQEELTADLPDKEITRSRHMLAIYYLLKGDFNIEHRSTHNVSDVAKFIHLLTGTKFSGLTNSEIYKKYKKIPSHKQGAELIKDLKFIRPYFESLQLKDAVALIDSEIQNALKEIPLSERKNYR